MKLGELANGIGKLHGGRTADIDIHSVTYDSRKCQHGGMFVAMAGRQRDGHEYIGCAAQLGAVCVVTDQPDRVECALPVLEVEDPRKAMAQLARRLSGNPDLTLKVIGVTGTNGKTTTTYMINHLLRNRAMCGRIGTLSYYNGMAEEKSLRTTPESSDFYQLLGEMISNGCCYAAVEVSSHGLELNRVFGLELAHGIFTNLTRDHLDFHGDMERYFQAKQKMFGMIREGGWAILNWDDAYARRIQIPSGRERVRFGQHPDAELRFDQVELGMKSASFEMRFRGEAVRVEMPLLGRHNIYNWCGAAAIALAEGLELKEIAELARSFRAVSGRCEILDLGQPYGVVIDFAHSPDALDNVIQACQDLKPKKLIVVFGAGGDRDKGKRVEMGRAVDKLADVLVLTSDNPRSEDPERIMDMVAQGIQRPNGPSFLRIADRRMAIRQALNLAEPGDLVLLAGKGHETTQEIGGKFYPFNDREVAASLIQQCGGHHG